jgi:hypothetical protein
MQRATLARIAAMIAMIMTLQYMHVDGPGDDHLVSRCTCCQQQKSFLAQL